MGYFASNAGSAGSNPAVRCELLWALKGVCAAIAQDVAELAKRRNVPRSLVPRQLILRSLDGNEYRTADCNACLLAREDD